MPDVEFGRPKNFSSAWVRIPDRNDPEYGKVDGSPHEHVAHLRERLLELVAVWMQGEFKELSLEDRMIPLETDDLRLLFQVNSFRRNLENEVFTKDWVRIPEESDNHWAYVLPTGYENYFWWQITHFDPDVKLGEYRLFCIEMNKTYKREKSITRFDEQSEFELVFATEEEISSLKNLLVGPDF